MTNISPKKPSYVIGVDYGSDSVRALLVDAMNGRELGLSIFEYPRWKKGLYCDSSKNQFRQHPLDYIEGFESVVKDVVKQCPNAASHIKALSIDTTGSTPVAVDEKGTPLALKPEFSENPNAMFILWKDHTAIKEADEINNIAHTWGGTDYTRYCGGSYSSEWFWAKILHIIRQDDKIEKAAYAWVEHCDWLPAMLTGHQNPIKIKRSRCAAGHKAMWHSDWNGFPSPDFLEILDRRLVKVRKNMNDQTLTSDHEVGIISEEWATRLGINNSVIIGVGALDAHIGAVGAEITPHFLCKVIGTSTCDMLMAPAKDIKGKLIKGISGQVDGSIIPGMEGMEAGQSAFGDTYAWFKKLLMWPIENILTHSEFIDCNQKEKIKDELSTKIIAKLTEEAEKIPAAETHLIALDWLNGRRTPDVNLSLKAIISGLTLGTDAPRIFRALVESTAFGSKAIIDRFIAEGIQVTGVIALGGVAKKSPFIMQILANVLNMPIQVVRSDQACALGAAMYASVVAGIHLNILEAQKNMGKGFEKIYFPDKEKVQEYRMLYNKYNKLGSFIEKSEL
ncbi:MAG: ribulokinase [Paludibacter sp.]|nr:ribulokinase [Paludibacter sp.]